MRASNSLHYREGREVFSAVTGGRPLSFSRRISGGSRSPEPFGLELMAERPVEGNAEGASLPAIASRSGEAGGTPPLIGRRKDQAGSLGTEEKTS